jgi:tetratricopeptide (TPR) repeat protein
VALSHRLHDADILVQRLTRGIVDQQAYSRARTVAKQQRSLGVDASRLGISDTAAIADLDKGLREAEDTRLVGEHEQAFQLHQQLHADQRFATPRAQRVLLSELALDRLMQAETLLQEKHHQDQVSRLLEEASEFYQRAYDADKSGNSVIIRWRQSRIYTIQERFEEARRMLTDALLQFERYGKPEYIRHSFYKAALKTRLGALAFDEYEARVAQTPTDVESTDLLKRAEDFFLQAIGDQRDIRPSVTPLPREWMLDSLDAYNNLAWYQFRRRDLEGAHETVQVAREAVDPSIWEQDIYFLGTMLAIELARLPGAPTLGELTLIDSLRIRILNIFSMPGTYVPRDTRKSMLETIREFEKRWHEAVAGSPGSP